MVDPLLLGLDSVSAVLTAVVAVAFARLWRDTRDLLDLALAIGFALVALSFLLSGGVFGDLPASSLTLGLRISVQVAGGLLLTSAYISLHRHGSVRLGLTFAWTVLLGAVLVTISYVFSLSEVRLPSLRAVEVVGNLALIPAFASCGFMSFSRTAGRPTLDWALVPAAFLSFAAENYTWLLSNLDPAGSLFPLPYLWRFMGIAFLLVAVGLPPRSRREPHAAA